MASGRFSTIVDNTWKISMILAIALLITWGGISIYANFFSQGTANLLPDFPDKAEYKVYITATRNTLLTKDYDQLTDTQFILHGYWEINDGKYKYRDIDLPLDEKYFGDIVITRL